MLLSRLRLAAIAIATALSTLSALPADAGDWGEIHMFGRMLKVYTPERLEDRNGPLLIGLHSAFGTADQFAQSFPIYMLADRYGFRVAYLDGTRIPRVADHRNWNAGKCCGEPQRDNVDDNGFISAVIDSAVRENITENEKVFIFGHSNGAMMAYRYACAHPERIRGVIGVSGSLSMPECESAGNVHVLHIHGTLDRIVPMQGGYASENSHFDHKSTDETLDTMHKAGARIELIRVQDGHHAMPDLNGKMKKQFGYDLPETVADFIDTHTFR
jgi:polyhydroxybutyrate depolymerase